MKKNNFENKKRINLRKKKKEMDFALSKIMGLIQSEKDITEISEELSERYGVNSIVIEKEINHLKSIHTDINLSMLYKFIKRNIYFLNIIIRLDELIKNKSNQKETIIFYLCVISCAKRRTGSLKQVSFLYSKKIGVNHNIIEAKANYILSIFNKKAKKRISTDLQTNRIISLLSNYSDVQLYRLINFVHKNESSLNKVIKLKHLISDRKSI